jgi:hypothetical protein
MGVKTSIKAGLICDCRKAETAAERRQCLINCANPVPEYNY